LHLTLISEGNSVEQCKEQMPNLRHEKPGS